MQDQRCFYCDRSAALDDLMVEIAPLKVSTLFLNRDQTHPGRCVVALNRHATEIYQLTEEERHDFIDDVANVSCAIGELYRPGKINYGIYGDLVPHLHVHIVPKTRDGVEWGETFENVSASPARLSEAQYAETVQAIREQLS